MKLVYDKRNNNRYEAVSTAGIATSSIDLKRERERETARNDFVGGRWSEWSVWPEPGKRCQLYTKVGGRGQQQRRKGHIWNNGLTEQRLVLYSTHILNELILAAGIGIVGHCVLPKGERQQRKTTAQIKIVSIETSFDVVVNTCCWGDS